ncbi:hypothetical protein M758_8G179200 [Ceratodon purpureus]|nr:hypothetical protein M758_8G179200 [Ceratodon purpureus]
MLIFFLHVVTPLPGRHRSSMFHAGCKPATSLCLNLGLRHHIVVGYQQHKYRNAQKVGEEAQIRIVDHLHEWGWCGSSGGSGRWRTSSLPALQLPQQLSFSSSKTARLQSNTTDVNEVPTPRSQERPVDAPQDRLLQKPTHELQ